MRVKVREKEEEGGRTTGRVRPGYRKGEKLK